MFQGTFSALDGNNYCLCFSGCLIELFCRNAFAFTISVALFAGVIGRNW